MMNRFIFFTSLILILIITPLYGNETTQRLDSVISLYHLHNNFNGTVLVAQHGEVIFAKGYGYANMEHAIPNTPESKYRIASISKQFTSMLVMQKVAEGKMSLDASVNTYIPDYPSPQGEVVTIHHLLSHTSGMPHYAGIQNFFPLYGRKAFNHREFVELFWELELMTPPGERYSYSSFGYYLLGYILEEVSGKNFGELLRERILQPLDMQHTGIEDHRQILNNRAMGYDHFLDGFLRAEFRDLSTALATGDMYTTPMDMVKWDEALRNHSLLEPSYQNILFEANLNGYGYGWNVGHLKMTENDSLYYQQHTGGTNGFTSISTRLPDDGYYLLVFCNTRPGEIRPIQQNIINVLYQQEVDFKPSIRLTAARILAEEGLQQSLDFLKHLKETPETPGELSLQHIGGLGRELSSASKHLEAIAFFELGTRLFPESANAMMMLGDALLAAGQTPDAVRSYARALLIDPEHSATLRRMEQSIYR